jgi:hypothetical protein
MDDSAAAVLRGVLVLDSVRIIVPDSQSEYFAYASAGSWATDLRFDHPEAGCFALREPGRAPVRMGGRPVVRDGLIAVGLNNWRYRQDSTGLVFELYRSPDASFGVDAHISSGRLVGIASGGGELYKADFGVRYVVGKRVGEPQPARCFAAAPSRWTPDSLSSIRIPDSLRQTDR